jgi:hypothetical protein
MRNRYKSLVRQLQRDRLLGRPSNRWEDNNKMKNSIFLDIRPLSQTLELFIITAGKTYKLTIIKYIKFEVFTPVTMKNALFWDVASGCTCV